MESNFDTKKILKEFSDVTGVGMQKNASKLAEKHLKKCCDKTEIDHMGNVFGYMNAYEESAKTFMLQAHIDEIGFVVTRIDDDGFVRVSSCGGVDQRLLTGTEVVIYGEKEEFSGIFCSIPPHLIKDKDSTLPDLGDRGIDIGLSFKEASRHIKAGDYVGFRPNFKMQTDTKAVGKSMDDRAGVVSVLKCLDVLQKNDVKLDFNLAVVFSVQEELGLRGSKVASFKVSPDTAIAVDVSFAYTPGSDKSDTRKLGGGPLIGHSPTLDRTMAKKLMKTAESIDMEYQVEVMASKTGTDADSINISKGGVKTSLVSIPLKYMHTPNEIVDINDIDNVGKLIAEFVETYSF